VSQDALGALAVKYASARNGKPKCSHCHDSDVKARVVLQVKLANNHPKSQRIVAGRMRSVCAECAVELFERMVAHLPEDGAA